GRFVVSATLLHADGFRRGDLDMVDIIPVPNRLEDPVRKAEGQNVLDRFFAQLVVDTVDLLLVEDVLNVQIEPAGGFVIPAQRLRDNYSPPIPVLFAHQTCAA